MARPYVYVSGYGSEGLLSEMPEASLMQKPLRFDRLLALIDNTLS